MINSSQLVQQLLDLGVTPGSVLLVHCAFSKVKPVEDGPLGLIAALGAALGPDGTLVMPSMTEDDDHPFDPEKTPCHGMGVVAQTFWQLPGVLRSNSPHAFSARGPQAARITADQPVDIPHGLDSPVGRLFELDGQVLLLGVGHDANTTIHLAEYLAGVRYRRKKYTTLLQNGHPVRFDYAEVDHCCQKFSLVGQWLEARSLQRHGKVGHADALLIRSLDIVMVALEHLQQDDTVFLHPSGIDEECDDARASLTGINGQVLIRPLGEEEDAEWLRLRLALWPDFKVEDLKCEMAALRLDRANQPVFVAGCPGGGLCGLVEVSIRRSAPGCTTDRIGYLEAWYVDPGWRAQGVGRRLVQVAEDWARAMGCREMASDTTPFYPISPSAHAALGYQETERYFRKDLD